MEFFKKNNKEKNTKDTKESKEKKGKKDPKMTDKKQFWVNLFTTLVIFFLLISTYSLIVEQRADIEEIPISKLAFDITEGVVASIVVKGDELEIIYISEEEKKSKK